MAQRNLPTAETDGASHLANEPSGRVLIAIMNNPRDWQIIRQAAWYRVPLKHYRRPLRIEYLAFYQSKVFGRQERWAVNYYAPVRSLSIVRRRDLFPDETWHPRADELYFRVNIEPLRRLPHPIVSERWRRVTFIHTTLAQLLRAREIGDLSP